MITALGAVFGRHFVGKLRDENISAKREFLAGNRVTLSGLGCEIANSGPAGGGRQLTFANPSAPCERHNEGAR